MRVLLVEDHLQLAESVAQALKSTGLTVDVLHDGVAADQEGGHDGSLVVEVITDFAGVGRPVDDPHGPF